MAQRCSDRPAAATVVRDALAPFADLGVVGAIATRARNIGGSDHTAFNNAGLPGINFRQDPIEYETHTHHTNLDTYERVVEDDAKAAATVIAATVYQTCDERRDAAALQERRDAAGGSTIGETGKPEI